MPYTTKVALIDWIKSNNYSGAKYAEMLTLGEQEILNTIAQKKPKVHVGGSVCVSCEG